MNFTEDRFFRGLRTVLALNQGRITVGEAPIEYINNVIIPDLQVALVHEVDEGKREEIEEKIELWEKYGDRKSPEGRDWNKNAAAIIVNVSNKFMFSKDDHEDIAAQISMDFFDKRKDWLRSFNVNSGPKGLLSLFKRVVGHAAIDEARKKISRDGLSRDEDKTHLLPSTFETELGSNEISEVKDVLADWMRKHLDGPILHLFNIWFEESKGKDPSRINWKKDIYPTWHEATGLLERSMHTIKDQMYLKIIWYLKNVEGLHVGKRTLKNLKLASEVVAARFLRRKLAAWVLAPYYEIRRFHGGV